jgi:hypothetical protein
MAEQAQLALARAEDAYRAGSYSEVLTLLETVPPSARSVLLLARVAQRRRQHGKVIELLTTGEGAALLDRAQKPVAYAILAVAAQNLRLDREAEWYESQIELTDELPPAAVADIVYYRAMLAWMRGSVESGLTLLEQQPDESAETRARFLLLRGWLEASRGALRQQAYCVHRALELLLAEAPAEGALLANGAHALSALVRELHFPEGVALVERLARDMRWTADLHAERFQLLRTLAWHDALAGRYIVALRGFARAKAIALTPVERMLAHMDHAEVAAAIGERVSMTQSFP